MTEEKIDPARKPYREVEEIYPDDLTEEEEEELWNLLQQKDMK